MQAPRPYTPKSGGRYPKPSGLTPMSSEMTDPRNDLLGAAWWSVTGDRFWPNDPHRLVPGTWRTASVSGGPGWTWRLHADVFHFNVIAWSAHEFHAMANRNALAESAFGARVVGTPVVVAKGARVRVLPCWSFVTLLEAYKIVQLYH